MALDVVSRCFPNDATKLLSVDDIPRRLSQELAQILEIFPPSDTYPVDEVKGLWCGPTGLAYLFHRVSVDQPTLLIAGHDAAHWARQYLQASRDGLLELTSARCGLTSEKMAYAAVCASVLQDPQYIRAFLAEIPWVVDEDFPDEMLHGRTGTLYMLRMIQRWAQPGPELAQQLVDATKQVSDKILSKLGAWTWLGRPYLGAIHGDFGIVAQLILSTPALASQLEPFLDGLLDTVQDGNWPTAVGGSNDLVQFCHGAPGVLTSLHSIRSLLSTASQSRVDARIKEASEFVWQYGLLKKEPSLCHGLFGTALALPPGDRRDHFLAFGTRESVAAFREKDPGNFEPADFGKKGAILTNYSPSAAWCWLQHDKRSFDLLLFSDV